MDDDTIDTTRDARGPHLPDVLTRSWIGWVFVVLAIGYTVWYTQNNPIKEAASLADFVLYVLQIVPALAAILLPAAIVFRHPDAWGHVRTLLFGAILYAAVQALNVFANPLQGFFETITPASEELPFLIPMAALYNSFTSLVAAFGLGYVAVGLSMARRYEDRSSRWVTGWFVPVATVFATVVGVVAVSRVDFGDTAMSPTLAVYLGASVILGVLRVAVWAFLASVLTRGWMAGEDPRPSWGMASLATGLVLFALALVNLSGLIEIPDNAFGTGLGYVIVIAYSGGHLLLLAAFLLGLPAIDDAFEDDFDDDDDEDEDDEYDDVEDDEDDEDDPAAN